MKSPPDLIVFPPEITVSEPEGIASRRETTAFIWGATHSGFLIPGAGAAQADDRSEPIRSQDRR